jgi:hypothetical protein
MASRKSFTAQEVFRVDQRVQDDELRDAAEVAERPVEAYGPAEIVHAQMRLTDVERVEERFERVGV